MKLYFFIKVQHTGDTDLGQAVYLFLIPYGRKTEECELSDIYGHHDNNTKSLLKENIALYSMSCINFLLSRGDAWHFIELAFCSIFSKYTSILQPH